MSDPGDDLRASLDLARAELLEADRERQSLSREVLGLAADLAALRSVAAELAKQGEVLMGGGWANVKQRDAFRAALAEYYAALPKGTPK